MVLGADHKKLRRYAHRSVKELASHIEAWAAAWNDNPKPFAWHKTAEEILERSPATAPPLASVLRSDTILCALQADRTLGELCSFGLGGTLCHRTLEGFDRVVVDADR